LSKPSSFCEGIIDYYNDLWNSNLKREPLEADGRSFDKLYSISFGDNFNSLDIRRSYPFPIVSIEDSKTQKMKEYFFSEMNKEFYKRSHNLMDEIDVFLKDVEWKPYNRHSI